MWSKHWFGGFDSGPACPHSATLLIKSGYPRIPANSKEQTMSNQQIVISGVGLWTPPHQISNEELVVSYNAFAHRYNAEHQTAIDSGELAPKPHSSAEFIEKA